LYCVYGKGFMGVGLFSGAPSMHNISSVSFAMHWHVTWLQILGNGHLGRLR